MVLSECRRVWAIIGDKLGDNAQIRTVAAALPWPVEEKQLTFWKPFRRGKPWFLPFLYHVDRRASAALAPPWPDLILTIGRRPAMAALWVKRQSGGRTRLAIFGPPKGFVAAFDLIVVPAQYKAPDQPALLRLDLPLIPLNHASVEAAGQRWQAQLQALPKPLTAVLVGGATQPFVFDKVVAERLVHDTRATTGGAGTLYFSTSRRTQPDAVLALQQALPGNAHLYRWQAGATEDNPYLGLLAHADRFVVTGDSVSMLVEVARLGRPLAVFALPQRRGVMGPRSVRNTRDERRAASTSDGSGGKTRDQGRAASTSDGAGGKARDLTEIHQVLYASGRAVPLGDAFLPARPPDVTLPGLEEVVCRIRELMQSPQENMRD